MQLSASEQANISAQVAELVGIAEGLIQGGRLAEARDVLETLNQVAPDTFAVLRMHGIACATQGDHAAAAKSLTVARELGRDALVANVLSVSLFALGDSLGALEAADEALALRPGFPEAFTNRGNALNGLGRSEEAVLAFREALLRAPHDAIAHLNLSNAYRDLKRHEEALASLERTIALAPNLAAAHRNRGNVLNDLGRPEEALACYDHALTLEPQAAETHFNRGNVLHELGRYAEAADSYARAGLYDPKHSKAFMNRSHCFLMVGDYARGWEEYEWRLSERGGPVPSRSFQAQRWTGRESLDGKSILLHAEQGLGDALQFTRYVGLVADLAAKVVFETYAPLMSLSRGRFGVAELIANGDTPPPVDFHCPLMSLPLAFMNAKVEAEPEVPYLSAEPEAVARWRARLGGGRLNVGLIVSGNPAHARDAQRSLPLEVLAGGLPEGAAYWLVQKQPRERDLAFLPQRPDIALISEEFGDFADTAALCEALDVVISVDTSVAHLAGALGCPTWILLPHFPDWRWGQNESERTHWYPSARLFRQKDPDDWTAVRDAVRRGLETLINR
jgi:tetratricopeptide (TPR) repeat protein